MKKLQEFIKTNINKSKGKKMRKTLISLVVVVIFILVFSFSGCAPAAEEPAAEEPAAEEPAAEEKVVRFMWTEYDGVAPEYTTDLEEAFNAANPGITLEILPFSWNDYEARLDTAIAGGEPPDIAVIGTRWLLKYMDLDLVEPIEQWVSESVLNDIVESTKEGEIAGELMALPVAAGPRFLWYRSDITEKPETFEEMKAMAEEVVNPPEIYGVGMIGTTPYVELTEFVYYFYGAGGDFFEVNADGTLGKCTVNSEAGVKALTFMKELVDEGLTQPTYLSDRRDEVMQLFVSGNIAYHMSGAFVESMLKQAEVTFEYSPALMPYFEGTEDPATIVITDSIMMFNTSEVKAEAGKVLDFIYQKEWRTPFDIQTNFPPVTKSSAEDEYFQTELFQIMNESMQSAKGWPLIAEWPRANDIIWGAIGKVFIENADPKAALDEAAAEVDAERGIQ